MYRRLASVLFLALVLCSALTPLASAASWVDQDDWTVTVATPVSTDLTVTPGASGAWVTGGYNFSSSYATSVGFRPLHDQDAYSLVLWFSPHNISGFHYLVGERDGAGENNVAIQQQDNDLQFTIGDGTTGRTIMLYNSLVKDRVVMAVWTWDKADDSGKLKSYIYDTTNGTLGSTTGTGQTVNSVCNIDLRLGYRHDNNYYFAGKMFYLAMYDYKLSAAEVALIAQLGQDVVYGNPEHYYTMNEAAGVTFNDFAANIWNHQDYWDGVSAVTNTPSYPAWELQDNYTMYVIGYLAPVIPTDPWAGIEEAWILLIGVVCFIAGPCLPAASIRASGWSKEKMWLILMGLLIWSFGYSLLFSF